VCLKNKCMPRKNICLFWLPSIFISELIESAFYCYQFPRSAPSFLMILWSSPNSKGWSTFAPNCPGFDSDVEQLGDWELNSWSSHWRLALTVACRISRGVEVSSSVQLWPRFLWEDRVFYRSIKAKFEDLNSNV
jgi:hypothetical protein